MGEPDWQEVMTGCERWLAARRPMRAAALHEHGAHAHLHGLKAELVGDRDRLVTLYKGLGGLAGSVLAGPEDLLAQARVWRRRHGGALFSLFTFAAAAQRGLESALGQMPRFLEHARAVAAALAAVPGVRVVPDPPQTPLFHVHLPGDPEELRVRALHVAERQGVWLFHRAQPSVVPGVSRVELHLGAPALEIAPAEAAELFAAVIG